MQTIHDARETGTGTSAGSPAGSPPTLAILEALALAASLTVHQIRERTGAASWTGCGLQDVLDSLRARRLVAYVDLHTYALTDAGRVALRGGAAHG